MASEPARTEEITREPSVQEYKSDFDKRTQDREPYMKDGVQQTGAEEVGLPDGASDDDTKVTDKKATKGLPRRASN